MKVCMESLPQEQNWAIESCVSLADLRRNVQHALANMVALPETSHQKSLSIDGEQIWIIEQLGKPYASVRSYSSERVIQYLEETKQDEATFVPLCMTQEMIARLEEVRDGKDPDERYALDEDGVELSLQRRHEVKSYNPERLKRYRDFTAIMNYEHLVDWDKLERLWKEHQNKDGSQGNHQVHHRSPGFPALAHT